MWPGAAALRTGRLGHMPYSGARMSGRTLQLRDGIWITNRKTDRRRAPVRPMLERLHELNERCRRRFPDSWVPDVRVGFLLPKTLDPFVSPGQHGPGINVHRGFAQIACGSTEQCFVRARDFLATVAKDRPAFTMVACISSSAQPGRYHGRHLTVVRGALVISSGVIEPRVFEGKAA